MKVKKKPRLPSNSANIPGMEARFIASDATHRVVRERRTIEDALNLSEKTRGALSDQDRSFARAIVTTSFRYLGFLRETIILFTKEGNIPEFGLLPEILYNASAQILFMDAKDHAAVDIAVELIKMDKKTTHYTKFANAILRKVATQKDEIILKVENYRNNVPFWMKERWCAFYGQETTKNIVNQFLSPPYIDITTNQIPEIFASKIGGVLLPTGSIRLNCEAPIPSLPGFEEGEFWVQDIASAIPARLCKAEAGMRVLDLCAAPGGKTAQLSQVGAYVVAVEKSEQRSMRLKENLARLRSSAVVVVADAAAFSAEPFDCVLLDAPCSATGTIRRHPEIAWNKSMEDIIGLARSQRCLLERAAGLVKSGGRLVYSTCSLEIEEGEGQMEWFMSAFPRFKVEPIRKEEVGGESEAITREGFLRILPSDFSTHGGADGFFAARFQLS